MNKYQRVRLRVVEKLKPKCARCGYDADVRALVIDHINNDGNIHRKVHRPGQVAYMRDIEKSIDARENRFQILCANCNTIKAQEERDLAKVIKEQISLLSLVDFTCEINRVVETNGN